MPFVPELIKVQKRDEEYINLMHDKDTISFAFNECFSKFGVTYNEEFKSYSIGINISNKFAETLREVETEATSFLSSPPKKPLLRRLVEKNDNKTLYLRLFEDQFDKSLLDVTSVVASGGITVTGIHLGENPSLMIKVEDMKIEEATRPKRKVEFLSSFN